jgi:hypothetical protein
MSTGSRTVTVLFCVLAARGQKAAAGDVPVLTVCEVLSDLDRYEGKSIVVVGRFGASEKALGYWKTAN